MHATPGTTLPARLHTLAAMAALLQKLEHTALSASAAQYQAVARQVLRLLADAEPDNHLDAILLTFPSAAELYENLRYEHAGLCRSPFDASLHAEMAAVSVIASAALPD